MNIYNRLDAILTQHADNDKVAGTIISIFTRMCVDSILRDKLLRDKGKYLASYNEVSLIIHIDFLSKITPLLERDACRQLVLQALSVITHHGGIDVRVEIAKRTPAFMRILEEFPDDATCAELAVVIMGHSTIAVVGNETSPDKKLLEAIDLPRLLPLLVSQLKRPNVSSLLVEHALEVFTKATQHCSRDFFALPSALNFLVACARCPDIQTRSITINALLRLHLAIAEKEEHMMDPRALMENVKRGVPKHLNDHIMSTGGPSESEIYRTLYATRECTQAMMRYMQDRNHDLFKLGLEIGRLILQAEHSVQHGAFQVKNKTTGEIEMADGLPFTYWIDALPLCANELRAKGTPDMLDMADIIDMKYLVLKNKTGDAQPIAERAIQRNPRIGFFYYVRTLGNNVEEGLRAAKKGSKCPNLTNYVKYAMLFRGLEHATRLGLRSLDECCTGDKSWNEGIAFLMCAYEDASEFLRSASLDNRGMKTVACLQPLLALIIKGHEFGPELRELRVSFSQLF